MGGSTNISGKRSFLDPPMNSCLLKGLQRRRLGMGQPRFRTPLWKRPPPAAPGPNQQELDSTAAHPVANRSDLLACAQFAKVRQSDKLRRCRIGPISHRNRVHDAICLCLDPNLVPESERR